MSNILLSIASPTWGLATLRKRNKQGLQRQNIIEQLNRLYLLISFVGICGIATLQDPPNTLPFFVRLIYGYFLFSRCTEIFSAFLKDAVDHLDQKAAQSSLSYGSRLSLALRSYLELIVDFALIYALLPAKYWSGDPAGVVDFVYFSGVTITTTGFGDIHPFHWLPKLLSIYEIFCGVTLLVVCFTIYTSRALQNGISSSAKDN